MPSTNTTDEAPVPDYYTKFKDTEPPTSRHRSSQTTSTQQLDSRSTTAPTVPPRPPRRDSQDLKPHKNEREPKSQSDRDLPDAPPVVNTTTSKQRTPPSPIDRHNARSSLNVETPSDSDSSNTFTEGYEDIGNPDALKELEREQSSIPKRWNASQDPPPGAAEGTAPRGSATYQLSAGRHPNAQVPPGHLPDDERQEMLEIRQSAQGSGYSQGGGVMGAIMSSLMPAIGPSPPKDKYQLMKENFRQAQYDLENHKQELRRTRKELHHAKHYIGELQQEKQRYTDHIGGLQNELNNVHQQLQDAKTLSEVRGKELFGAQVFLTKADTLSISEVGEKVTALNEEIFQAAATLGEALIHKRHELSQADLDAAMAECQEMVGLKITGLLIGQSQKPEPEVNPLLVQVVLQIFMVKFCVSKIRSWYPGDPTIGGFLTAIYSEIRSTEEQAVSGRWRALTRAHTRPSSETWTTELFKRLMSVLKVAAWTAAPENQDSFLHRLPPIFKAVSELRTAIGEKFTSADLDISVFDCDVAYQSSYMDDAYSDGRQPSGKRGPEHIVGTTGIGLKQLVTERNAKDTLRFRSVISAKIVLESTLNEALEPVQSSSRNTKKKKPVDMDGADQEVRKAKTGFNMSSAV